MYIFTFIFINIFIVYTHKHTYICILSHRDYTICIIY